MDSPAKSDDVSEIPIRVLVVDDDEAHAQAVAESLRVIGSDCTVANSGESGANRIESDQYDVVVTDMMMEGTDGLAILSKAKEELPDAEVIVVTGHGSISSAVTAMQHGAYSYLAKPLDIQELRAAVDKASTRVRLIRKNAELSRRLDERFGFEGVIGTSTQMNRIIDILRNVSPTDSTVLITGENGTGKELVARALHQNSPRKNKPFVPLNVAALPESILESELFGHEAGAFTGAMGRRVGKFEYANGGTLFLDEVGEMPLDIQVKLLRVLEERKITRLGGNDEVPINVRLVAATNADLKQLVAEKRFRDDLYYRINVVSIHLPPLRERRGDIPLLLDHFQKEITQRSGKEVRGFTRTARQALMSYEWPGNIRQLRNSVERMIVLDIDGMLDKDDLPEEIAPLARDEDETGEILPTADSGADQLIGRPMNEVEKYYIQRALEVTSGKREEAAKMLGIGERTLYRKIKEFGLK
ncbi:sigma-54-dependent transcriptional regulator [Stratiformator vulcanicus]|uniref:DNA-binding transcriptional response regulator n=1 Tax=Stratiformator vulcanicus TaxID=2527980 RepID=A0A517QX80_9PLAN|nr:sigma-54 dependent transcriptional regulator [Stratiformator vulcanicus]QDT36214.1 DNA-binding transcriptional response regulator [Stratiformator vulcanicus]